MSPEGSYHRGLGFSRSEQRSNGVSELLVSKAQINAAQLCSDQRLHLASHPGGDQAVFDASYPCSFGDNLTVFTRTTDAAQRAVDNWINSSCHFETMND